MGESTFTKFLIMKIKPILFSTPMVQAILEGRKTQTRRVVKDKLLQNNKDQSDEEFPLVTMRKCPYGQIGDVLWVRETWQNSANNVYYHFKADFTDPGKGWKPSIFMPKDAARIWLKITDVRVERLNDISAEDAQKEGITWNQGEEWEAKYGNAYTYKFKMLWDSINGEKQPWKSNPWVWVIEFERIEKPSEV